MPSTGAIKLNLIPIGKLIPHEETVPYLTERLSHKMIRDGVQRDPIIVDEKTKVVLDGMHRLAALKRMGAKSVVSSLVDYPSDGMKLFRWYRFVEEPHEAAVSAAQRELGTTEEVSFSWDEAALQSGLILIHRGKAYTGRRGESLEALMEATRRFDRVVTELGSKVGYVDESTATPELLSGAYMALLTPRLRKEDVAHAASRGKLFPPKNNPARTAGSPDGNKLPNRGPKETERHTGEDAIDEEPKTDRTAFVLSWETLQGTRGGPGMTITVKCLGHIRTSVGRETVEIQKDGMSAGELIDALREMGASDPHLGFNKFNTLLVVNGESAFTAAADDRKLKDGDQVLLVPFSHGG